MRLENMNDADWISLVDFVTYEQSDPCDDRPDDVAICGVILAKIHAFRHKGQPTPDFDEKEMALIDRVVESEVLTCAVNWDDADNRKAAMVLPAPVWQGQECTERNPEPAGPR